MKPPSRAIAIGLAMCTAWGLGHYYLGLRKRAVGWLVGNGVGFVIVAAAIPLFGKTVGFMPLFILLLAAVAVMWAGPMVDLARVKKERFERVPWWKVLGFYVVSALATLAWSYGARTFLLEAFKLPSGSMRPSLEIQDHVFVEKSTYRPKAVQIAGTSKRLPTGRGDLVVFEIPYSLPGESPQDFIKRTIAVEGDTLEMDDGHPIINGWRVPSCLVGEYRYEEGGDQEDLRGKIYVEFLGDNAYLVILDERSRNLAHRGPYLVSPGEFWVLGDNRDNSSDSRSWRGGRGGGVPYENLKGHALFVWLAFHSDKSVRWDRIGIDLSGEPRLPSDASPELVQALSRCLAKRPAQTLPPPPETASL